jgi:hypothetical protein
MLSRSRVERASRSSRVTISTSPGPSLRIAFLSQLLSSWPVACFRGPPVSRLCAMKFFDSIFNGLQPAPPPPDGANHESSDKPQQRDWPQQNTPQDGAMVASFQQSVSQANRRHVSSGSQAPIFRMAFPSVGLVVLSYVPQTSAGHQTRFNACGIGFVGSLVLSDQQIG